jgi:hypothetical protein
LAAHDFGRASGAGPRGQPSNLNGAFMFVGTDVNGLCARLDAAPHPAAREAIRVAAEADVAHRRRVSNAWVEWLRDARERRQLECVGCPYAYRR